VNQASRLEATTLLPVPTRTLLPPKEDLWDALDSALSVLQNGDVVAITSKVVAIAQGRCVPVETVADKEELVEAESDATSTRGLMSSRLSSEKMKGSAAHQPVYAVTIPAQRSR
jgi:F420-0:gamma-glutamyl ligase